MERVAGLHPAHAGRRSRHQEIAGGERDAAGQVGDRLRHAPDHLGEVAALPDGAVHTGLDRAPVRMPDLRRRRDRADGAGPVEALREVPGPGQLLRFGLEVAPRHVEPHRVAVDMRQGVGLRDVPPIRADGDHELDLVVQILRPAREGQGAAAGHDGIGRLGEEEGRLAVRIMPHLPRVIGIVAADAPDAPHGEHGVFAGDGDGGAFWRRDDEGHADTSFEAVGSVAAHAIVSRGTAVRFLRSAMPWLTNRTV